MNEGGNPKNIASIYDQYDDVQKALSIMGIFISGEIPLVANVTGSVLLVGCVQ